MSLTFSSALLLYPTELKTGSLYNAVHWLSHRSGKVDASVLNLAYFSIFDGAFNKIIITLALAHMGWIMTNAFLSSQFQRAHVE